MECNRISPACPVEATTYGYYPTLPGNIIFAVIFALCAIAQVILGIVYRLKVYTTLVFLGCAGEVVGYIGRIMMHLNPWSSSGFIMQILLLIVSPSFLAAGIYLTLKHLILHYGPDNSRLKPHLYTWVFVTCDAIGFVTQLVGGGVQATASNGKVSGKMIDIGNKIMVTGITFQAITMTACGILAIDFAQRSYRHRTKCSNQRPPSTKGPNPPAFYITCTATAFVTILVRCIYRIPEMAGGWGNKLMRNEVEFMILDGAMIAIGAILLTLAYPGKFFLTISSRIYPENVYVEDGVLLCQTKPNPQS